MENFLFSEITYLLDFIKLTLICVLWLKVGIDYKKRFVVSVIISMFSIVILSIFSYVYGYSVIYGIYTLIILWISTNKKQRIGLCVLSYILLQIVETIVCTIVMIGLSLKPVDFVENYWLYVPMNCIVLVLIGGISMFAHHRNIRDIYIPKSYIFVLFMGGIVFCLYMSSIQFVGLQSNNNAFQIAVLSITISSVIFVIIAILLISNRSKNDKLQYELRLNEKMVEQKEEYYNMIVDKDNETRKFRHDIKNHLYSMEILLKNSEYDELNKYFENLNQDFNNISTAINTGNDMVNAIVNHLMGKLNGVKLHWTGLLPKELKMDSKNICTIFSNLLSNAFEAAEKTNKGVVEVVVKMVEHNLFLSITNTTNSSLNIEKGMLRSTKKGPDHGYGIQNIKECVEKYNGTFEYKLEGELFITEIVLVNII